MTTLLRVASGRGTRWVHVPVSLLYLLITASYLAPRSVMRTDAYVIAVLLIAAVDCGLCWLLRVANVAMDTVREGRRR